MFKSIEGQRVPQVTFKTRRDHEWVDRSSDDIFAGKIGYRLFAARCIHADMFVVARASLQPAEPWFKAPTVLTKIICVSVNDAFVMDEWKHSQKADRVTFLPDGNGDFTDCDGSARRQGRPRLRQALLALLDAGSRRCHREDVHRAGKAR